MDSKDRPACIHTSGDEGGRGLLMNVRYPSAHYFDDQWVHQCLSAEQEWERTSCN